MGSARYPAATNSRSRNGRFALLRCASSMTPVNLLRLWRARLSSRAMLVQEGLAVVGIAIGVALLFASQVASTSLSGSVRQLTAAGIGLNQQLQLDSRGPSGVDEQLAGRVSRLPGVQGVAPVLEQSATVIGPKGSQAVVLLGVSLQFATAGGPIVAHLSTRRSEEHTSELQSPRHLV